jgi:hypothetical protein
MKLRDLSLLIFICQKNSILNRWSKDEKDSDQNSFVQYHQTTSLVWYMSDYDIQKWANWFDLVLCKKKVDQNYTTEAIYNMSMIPEISLKMFEKVLHDCLWDVLKLITTTSWIFSPFLKILFNLYQCKFSEIRIVYCREWSRMIAKLIA